jgi:hypothetical protein
VVAVTQAEQVRRACSPGAVLFDWNGTLADDLARSHTAACGVLESRGLPAMSIAQLRLLSDQLSSGHS